MNSKRQVYPSFLFLLISGLFYYDQCNGQTALKGTVMDSRTDSALNAATVFNKSRQVYQKSSPDGHFLIDAAPGDTVIFSYVNYRSDTIKVVPELLVQGLYLGLKYQPFVMKKVTVFSPTYLQDSLRRNENYSSSYNYTRGVFSSSTPTNGFGVKVSPFSFFSKEERSKRKLKKQLVYQEEQSYIDFQYSPSLVHRITGLTGETLQLFMRTYRPSYQFVRRSNPEDLLQYINDSYKKFKGKPVYQN